MIRFDPDALAVFSDDGVYRYYLRRDHSPLLTGRPLLWTMLNPSVAGRRRDDPTTTLTCNLGKAWGFGIHLAVNCNALVGTDPDCLESHPDPVGPLNDAFVRGAAAWCLDRGGRIVVAWGSGGRLGGRHDVMLRLLADAGARDLWCLGRNADGTPRFPRAIPRTAQLQPWQKDDGHA